MADNDASICPHWMHWLKVAVGISNVMNVMNVARDCVRAPYAERGFDSNTSRSDRDQCALSGCPQTAGRVHEPRFSALAVK